MKSGDARVALIGFPSVGKVRRDNDHFTLRTWLEYFVESLTVCIFVGEVKSNNTVHAISA